MSYQRLLLRMRTHPGVSRERQNLLFRSTHSRPPGPWLIVLDAAKVVSHADDAKSNAVTLHHFKNLRNTLKVTTDAIPDESRPFCTRCAKSRNNCEGYQDNQAFVWVDPKGSDPQHTLSNAESSSSSATAATVHSETFSVQPTSAAHQKAFFALIDPVTFQRFSLSGLSLTVDQHAFQESIYQTHLFQHLLGYTEIGRNSALAIPIMNNLDLNRYAVESRMF